MVTLEFGTAATRCGYGLGKRIDTNQNLHYSRIIVVFWRYQMSYTYTCYHCYGKFEGSGVYHRRGALCPQCATVIQQEEQFKEMQEQREADRKREEDRQREENYRRQRERDEDIKRENERERQRKEEEDRRYWEDYDRRERQNSQRPVYNNMTSSQDAALHNLAGVLAKHVEKIIDKKLNTEVKKDRCQPGVVWPEEKKPALNFIEQQRIASVYERYLERERLKEQQNPNSD